MKRPPDLQPGPGLDPRKQQLNVDIIAVQIVKPEHVRIVFICPTEKALCDAPAVQTGRVKDPGLQRIQVNASVAADADGVFLKGLRNGFPAPGDPDLASLVFKSLRQIGADPSSAADAADGVDHQNPHAFRISLMRWQ
jgi:hypothetical protein